MLDAVALLSHRGSDLIVFHVLDPAELELPLRPARQPTRTWRAASASPWCRTRCASAIARWWPSTSRASSRVLGREPDRLRALRHLEAPRPRAVQLPLAPRARGAGPLMGFLTPAFLAGLAALAVPVLVHLTNRPRSETVPFPSLMFLQRIPYRSVRRQSLRNWLLFALRCAGLRDPGPGLCAAVLRPREPGRHRPGRGAGADRAPRPVVQHGLRRAAGRAPWRPRARGRRAGPRRIAPPSSSSTRAPESTGEPTADARGRPGRAGRGAARLRRDPLRAGPPRWPRRCSTPSSVPGREIVLITDFQKTGWEGADDVRLPAGHHAHLDRRVRARRVQPRHHRRRPGAGLRGGPRARDRRRAPREQGRAAGEATLARDPRTFPAGRSCSSPISRRRDGRARTTSSCLRPRPSPGWTSPIAPPPTSPSPVSRWSGTTTPAASVSSLPPASSTRARDRWRARR